jgi:hypothetical protein
VRTYALHNLRLEPIVQGVPLWATSVDPANCWTQSALPPTAAGVTDYANFAAAVASRYGPGGTFWAQNTDLTPKPIDTYEIWNEPNLQEWWCQGSNPERYAALYLAARAAIQAVDPGAEAMAAGLYPPGTPGTAWPSYSAAEFLSRAVTARPTFASADSIGAHIYQPGAPEDMAMLQQLWDALNGAGMSATKIVINEFGWPTQGFLFFPHPEAERASIITETVNAMLNSGCQIEGVALHALVSREQDPFNSVEFFGVTSPTDGSLYPSAVSYQTEIADFTGGPSPPYGPCWTL